MSKVNSVDSEILWRRIGLKELRQALIGVEVLTRQFEEALRALPTCDECARTVLLEQINAAGSRLSSQVVSLAVLASTLKKAGAKAEEKIGQLMERPPDPCHCPSRECTCHSPR